MPDASILVFGKTQSQDLPASFEGTKKRFSPNEDPQTRKSRGDSFLLKLSHDLSRLLYASYLGIEGEVLLMSSLAENGSIFAGRSWPSTDLFVFKLPLPGNIDISRSLVVLRIGNSFAFSQGKIKKLEVAPFIQENRSMIPFRFVGEAFGASVNFTVDAQGLVDTVRYELHASTITLYIGRKEAQVNQQTIVLDTAPIIIKGRTMVPLRFVIQHLGFEVDWRPDTQDILITEQNR